MASTNTKDAVSTAAADSTTTSSVESTGCVSYPGYDCTIPHWYTFNEYRAVGRYLSAHKELVLTLPLSLSMKLAGYGP